MRDVPVPGTKEDLRAQIEAHIRAGFKERAQRKFSMESQVVKKYFPKIEAKMNPPPSPPKRAITLAPKGSANNPIIKTKPDEKPHPLLNIKPPSPVKAKVKKNKN